VRVYVSIHDVAPPFRDEVERALDMVHAAGIRPGLLVVPDHHGQAPLTKDRSFCAFLRSLQDDGHEIFLHGFLHQSPPRIDGVTQGLSSWFAQRVVSNGEAEMVGLSRQEAAWRLDAGEACLHRAGLVVDGFVPPAWVMPRWLLPLLAARGWGYAEDHLRVYDPSEGRSRPSLVLNYATRTPLRLLSSVAFCRVATAFSALAPTRIAIHPLDMRSPSLRRELERLLSWGRGRSVSRARELLE
jgi:predicted deacetylase